MPPKVGLQLTVFAALFLWGVSLAAALEGVSLAPALELHEDDGAISITHGDKLLLKYHKAEMPPPAGKDKSFTRSGFIHPINSPSGFPLTAIHPDDHTHHMGFWHAWVKTEHGKRKPDFWNIGRDPSGTLRFKKTLALSDGETAKGFTVCQEHVSMNEGADPVVVLEEQFTVAARVLPDGSYAIDYQTVQKNITDTVLKLPAYRYGGPIAYRGPTHWNKDNSRVLTSEGKTRKNGHTTRGRWVAFAGPAEVGAKASLAILCHPNNHDAPQRMRIWPANSHNGAVFFNYVPIQESAWAIKPGESSTMRYRIIASDGGIVAKALNALWESYSKE